MTILAIETSCDETSSSVVRNGTDILNNVIASSSTMHEKWGGIVPEVAAREQLRCFIPVLTEALSCFSDSQQFDSTPQPLLPIIQNHIDAIAVTVGPGLIGSLLIGIESARTIAWISKKPLIPVNHVLAHMYANFLLPKNRRQKAKDRNIQFPAISLVVSGGHTELFLMKNEKELKWIGGTIDDAAGEAFDKTARLLGFGHGGGLAIQEAAIQSKIQNSEFRITLPRPMMHDDSLNFSFSGLKTAVSREIAALQKKKEWTTDIINACAYEVQEAITDVLVTKTLRAANYHKAQSILISGGVASNERLREKFQKEVQQTAIAFFCPPINLCTDNAAYIASYAYFRGIPVDWHNVKAEPDLSVEVTS